MARLPRGEALASRLRGRRRAARAHARGVGGRGQRERSRRRARRHPRSSAPHERAVAGRQPGAPPQSRRALARGRHAHGPLARGASRAPRARRGDDPARPVGTGPRQTGRRDEVNCKVPPQEPRVPDQSDGGIRERRAHPELAAEQRYLDRAYGRLDEMRKAASRVAEGYSEVQRGGTHQARLERDAAAANTRRRLAALNIGNAPLSFGRIDLEPRSDGESAGDDRFYIGPISLTEADQTPLIVDWRAPVAEPFYRATGVEPMGVVRRRHFQTHRRGLVGIDDEVFDAAAADEAGFTIVGEAALLAALERHRTGRMGDIVATIQAEQDEAVRAPLSGIIVVAGGPGTGKTAVALHRAAYLLYTHRQRLASRGVLLVGPSPIFLRYIDEVLPSLGEDDVQLTTVAGLKPQLRARAAAAEPESTPLDPPPQQNSDARVLLEKKK